MNVSATWLETIKLIEPNIKKLTKEMINTIPIISDLENRNGRWVIRIREDVHPDEFYNSKQLEDATDWTASQLIEWPNCWRIADDEWLFDNLDDAKKFKTVFSLRWV